MKLKERLKNIILCIKYPFLRPRNVWTGKKTPKWFGSYTILDEMPAGWREKIGLPLCKELKAELKRSKLLKHYQVLQVKEKYGVLCWYDTQNTEEGYNIIHKYEKKSAEVCIHCGNAAEYVSRGWIAYLCKNCAIKNYEATKKYLNDIDLDSYLDNNYLKINDKQE